MPKKTAKIGLVSIKLEKDDRWRARWWDAKQQKYFRRLLPATTYAEAVAQAKVFNQTISAEKGFIPSVRAKAGHGVSEAIGEMIANADATIRTKKDYAGHGNQFIAWLREFRPGVSQWAQVNAKILRDFLRHSEAKSLAHDSIRLRFHVLRATSLFMSQTYPDRYAHLAAPVKIKRPKGIAAGSKSRKVLSAREVCDLLSIVKRERPDLLGMMLLQATCGLRVTEASNLRECDIDFEEGKITITETSRHSPKTRTSFRTIPVPASTIEQLQRTLEGLTVRHREGFIFLTRDGEPWGVDGLSHAMRRVICTAWRETNHDGLKSFMSRRLRATFITLVREQRADYRVLKAYVGHAAGDVLGDNYEHTSSDRFREEIVTRIESSLAAGGQAKLDSSASDHQLAEVI